MPESAEADCEGCGKRIRKSGWSMSGWQHVGTGSAMCAPIQYARPAKRGVQLDELTQDARP